MLTGQLAPAQGTNALRFEEVFTYSLGSYWCEQNRLTVADVDHDGRKDIVAMVTAYVGGVERYRCRALLFRSLPGERFEESLIADFPGDYAYAAQSGDMNNDGAPDLVLRAWLKTYILLNDGRGKFSDRWTTPTGFYIAPPVDLNGDGSLDLVSGTQTEAGGFIEAFSNDGTGTNFLKFWQSRLYEGRLNSVESVLAVNLNGDGRMDLVAREIYGGRLITLFGSDSPNVFVESEVMMPGGPVYSLASGRVNNDSRDDLAYYLGWGSAHVFVTETNGSLKKVWESPFLDDLAFNIALADFDRDGFDDLFVGTFDRGGLRIYRNNGGTGFSPWWEDSIPGEGYSGAVADVNGDGWPDLILSDQDEGSGASNFRVWLNRSGPMRVIQVECTATGTVVTWTAVPGKSYRLQFKERLDHAWNNVDGDVTALAPSASQTDPAATATAQRFYRVLELP